MLEGSSDHDSKEKFDTKSLNMEKYPKVSGYYKQKPKRRKHSKFIDKKVGMEFKSKCSDNCKSSLKASQSFATIPTRKFEKLTYQEILYLKTKKRKNFKGYLKEITNYNRQNGIYKRENTYVGNKNGIENTNVETDLFEKNNCCKLGSDLNGNNFQKHHTNFVDKNNDSGYFYRSPRQSKKLTSFYEAVEPLSGESSNKFSFNINNKTKTNLDDIFADNYKIRKDNRKMDNIESFGKSIQAFSKISPFTYKPKSKEKLYCNKNEMPKINNKKLLNFVKDNRNSESKDMVKPLQRCIQHFSNSFDKFSILDDLKNSNFNGNRNCSNISSEFMPLKEKCSYHDESVENNQCGLKKVVKFEVNSKDKKCKCEQSIKSVKPNSSNVNYYRDKVSSFCTQNSTLMKTGFLSSKQDFKSDINDLLCEESKHLVADSLCNFDFIEKCNQDFKFDQSNVNEPKVKLSTLYVTSSLEKQNAEKNNFKENSHQKDNRKFVNKQNSNSSIESSKNDSNEYIFPGVTRSDVDREMEKSYVNFRFNSENYCFQKPIKKNLSFFNYQVPRKKLDQTCKDCSPNKNKLVKSKVVEENNKQNNFVEQNMMVSNCNESELTEPYTSVQSDEIIRNIEKNKTYDIKNVSPKVYDHLKTKSYNKTKQTDDYIVSISQVSCKTTINANNEINTFENSVRIDYKQTKYSLTKKENDQNADFSLLKEDKSYTLQRFIFDRLSTVGNFSKNKVQNIVESLKNISDKLPKSKEKEYFGESLETIYQRPESFDSKYDSVITGNAENNRINVNKNESMLDYRDKLQSASMKNVGFCSKLSEVDSYFSDEKSEKYQSNNTYPESEAHCKNPRETDLNLSKKFNKNNFNYNNKDKNKRINSHVQAASVKECSCSNCSFNYNVKKIKNNVDKDSISEAISEENISENYPSSRFDSKYTFLSEKLPRQTKNKNFFKTNNRKSLRKQNESIISDDSLLDMDNQVYENNSTKKENKSSQFSKEDSKKARKRSHSSTIKSDVEEKKEVKEKRRRKTPFYICEKTNNSIILHRPIIIKSDDVARLKYSEKDQKAAANKKSSDCNLERDSLKENRKSSSKTSEKSKWKKTRNQDILTSNSTFLGANSYFKKFSNSNHSDETSDS